MKEKKKRRAEINEIENRKTQKNEKLNKLISLQPDEDRKNERRKKLAVLGMKDGATLRI